MRPNSDVTPNYVLVGDSRIPCVGLYKITPGRGVKMLERWHSDDKYDVKKMYQLASKHECNNVMWSWHASPDFSHPPRGRRRVTVCGGAGNEAHDSQIDRGLWSGWSDAASAGSPPVVPKTASHFNNEGV